MGRKKPGAGSSHHWQQILSLGNIFSSILDPAELHHKVVDLIHERFGFSHVYLFSVHSGRRKIFFETGSGHGLEKLARHGFSLELDDPHEAISQVARQEETVYNNEFSLIASPNSEIPLPQDIGSRLTLPIKFEETVLGVLDIYRNQANAFGEPEISLLETLAETIAIAIRNADLHHSEQWKRRVTERLSETAGLLSAEVSLEEMLAAVLGELEKNIPCDLAAIWFTEEETAEEMDDLPETDQTPELQPLPALRLAAVSGPLAGWLEPQIGLNIDEILYNVIGYTVISDWGDSNENNGNTGESDTDNANTEDSGEGSDGEANLDEPGAIRSEEGGETNLPAWGTSGLQTERPVINAGDVTEDTGAEAHHTGERGGDNEDNDAGAEESGSETRQTGEPVGSDEETRGSDNNGKENEAEKDSGLETQHTEEAGEANLPEWVTGGLQTERPIIRAGEPREDSFGALLELPEDYSALAAALHLRDKRIGLLTIVHHATNFYGSEAVDMAATFANYASVAIQNGRLFQSAHEQIWVSTVLLQVDEATQSVDDLNELLLTIANITPTLAGVRACAIYLAEEDGIFFPAAASGLLPEGQFEFERQFFAPGDLPALDHLWNDKHPTVLQREGDDLSMARLFAAQPVKSQMLELLILVPLIGHGEVLGVMVVQYVSDPLMGSIQALENFFDERLGILQGIAHQTAAGLENIRLIKSQKEEAYVSVALLQVAQAIVSSSDLIETLGSIVRITPILTGVKRVAIYLYEQKTVQFRLVQSYGLPRDADIYPYTPDEFPLLSAAYERNMVVAFPVNPKADEDWEDVPDVWTYQSVLEQDLVEAVLTGQARLLVAFPLAVMGEVLGVMVVEEPDNVRAGSLGNLRLRPKRLEIITGISQQAALAIQNDQLKQEMVDRQRLEREMQLAREIQRTFLPGQLPEINGWELTVWWRTAREVGGDFYDLIHLADGRLGMVIADVADKGVPAALFMVLVRALLRASSKESGSPAEVLAQVNDLLTPDAHGGMFVTLFYAILDPLSGQVSYANAGHNPPLWVRHSDQTTTQLTKTGMALGVMEDFSIREDAISLSPGDFLVLYTDGVTEAFSASGETYDYERLHEVITETAFRAEGGSAAAETLPVAENKPSAKNILSAKTMLKAIDASIEAFTAGVAPADDSTVLILYRQHTDQE